MPMVYNRSARQIQIHSLQLPDTISASLQLNLNLYLSPCICICICICKWRCS